jgi:uncharacterized protein (TIGR03437 family)
LTLGVCAAILLIVSLKLSNHRSSHRSSPASSPKSRASVSNPSPSVSGKASAKSVAAASSGHALNAEIAQASRQTATEVAEPHEEIESDEKPGADEWFREQRAYPLREIPIAARMRAFDQLEREEQRLRQLKGAPRDGAVEAETAQEPGWLPLGPQPIANGNTGAVQRPVSGRISAVALDPGYDGIGNRTVYAGAAQGGLWRSRDNGATWTPLIDDQPSLAIGSLAIDPSNPNVIYVGTGEGNNSGDSYYGAGLLKSVDGGATWAQITGPVSTVDPQVPAFLNSSIADITIDPANTQTVYLCTKTAATYGASGGSGTAPLGQRGVWKSTDGGATWRNLDPANGNFSANEVALDPQNPNRVFAGVQAQGIFRSNSGGEPGTWQRLAGGLPATGLGRVAFALGPPLPPSTNATIYAAISASTGLAGLFRTTDNGDNWTKLNDPPNVAQSAYNLTLAVDPVDANIVYFGLVNFYRSVDGGQTWVSQMAGNNNGESGLHVDQHALAVFPGNRNILFIGNDGGMWRSDNAVASPMGWQNLNQTLNTVQFQSVAVHPLDVNFLLGGTQDNGSNRFTGDPAWQRVAGGDGGFALIDQSNPSIVYHSFQNSSQSATAGASFGPRVSFNGGDTWIERGCRSCTAAPGRMNPTDRVGFYAPMALHTGFTAPPGNVIYWGTNRLYRSTNTGQTWIGLGPSTDGFGQDLAPTTGRLSAIAAHPRLDNSANPPGEIVWVGTSNGLVQVTTNAGALEGAVFTNVVKAPLPNRFVTDIALDPNNPQRAYVTYSGFNVSTPSAPGHVFVTENLGENWRDISGNLPDAPVTSIALDPFRANTLYIGSDLGVFQTADGGATWTRLGNGMPRVATFMVRYHAATRSLIAATHGRGMFRLPLTRAVTTVSAASFSSTALAVEGIVSAFGTGLATATAPATSLPLPTTLAGTTVRIRDVAGNEHQAPLFFVSPQQVNFQIPGETAPGPIAVTITSGDGTVSTGSERAFAVAPSLFAANANGRGVPAAFAVRVRNGVQTQLAVAQFDNATNQFVPVEIDLGPEGDQVVLVLYGSGIRRRSALSAVRVAIGGADAQTIYAGEAPGFVGLDQVNAIIPRSLIGRGAVDVVLSVDGGTANRVTIRIR